MDIRVLADTIARILVPAVSCMADGKVLVQHAGTSQMSLLETLWATLLPKIEMKPAALEAIQEVANSPEDADAHASLRLQLRKIFGEDSALAAEITKILEEAAPTSYHAELHGSGAIAQGVGNVVAGAGGIAAGGNITAKEEGKIVRGTSDTGPRRSN